jgi:hypothetical protein
MKTHLLKTLPQYFDRVESGNKPFEVRKNDRDFQTGDTLRLVRLDDFGNISINQAIEVEVTYILHGPRFGIEDGYCVMAIKPLSFP